VTWPHLSKAPITEALLDIRVEAARETTLTTLAGFHDFVRDRYPQREERRFEQIELQLDAVGGTRFSRAGAATGYLMKAPSNEKVVQARLDGFTLNKLRPYETWELLRDEARELWDTYVRVASPQRVTRVALRFINRLELPLPLPSFKEYVLTLPEVAPSLPQELADFFMRLVIPKPEIDAAVILHETLAPPNDPDHLPMILDIDAFATVALDPASPEVWSRLELLRDFKNEIFFGSVSERCVEMYK
jgi:uncharacterized protein (TIGR04255 family)